MTSDDMERFTELLCSRLCHDLISPIGAIRNGLELVAEGDGGLLKDAISLIGLSSRQASARLAYFRLAFGAWGSAGVLGFGAIRGIVEEHFNEKKCPVTWSEPVPVDESLVDKRIGKLVLNLLLVAAECAQRDGDVRGALVLDRTGPRVSIVVRADRCKLRDDVRSGFVEDIEVSALTVRNVVAHHCQRLCQSLALDLTITDHGSNSLEFCAA